MKHSGYWLLLVIALVVAGCAGSGVVSTQLTTIVSSHTDATGDAAAETSSGTPHDILTVETRRIDNAPFGSYDTLRTDITFGSAPVLPDPGNFPTLGTHLAFRVYFDTDKNAATGSWWNGMCLNPQGGSEYIVDATAASDVIAPLPAPQGRLANANYAVVDGTTTVGEATVAQSGSVVTVTVPLSVLGNDDGATNLSVRVGNGVDVTTDCTPEAAGVIPTQQGR